MKKTKLSLIVLFTITLLLGVVISVNAEDEVTFPGKFNLEFKSQLDSDIIDSKPGETRSGGNGDIYLRNELKGKVKFEVTNFYDLTLWLKDRIDLKWYRENGTKTYTDTNGDDVTIAKSGDGITLKPRNRFYMGIDNTFKIKDVMNINIGFFSRLSNRIDKDTLYLQLTPTFSLEGEYDFELSWEVNTLYEFNLYPSDYTDPVAKDNLLQNFTFEIDTLNISYEFFHHFAPKKVKCSFVFDMYLGTISYMGYERYDKSEDGSPMDMIENLDLYAGLNFSLWDIKPYIGFYGKFSQYENAGASGIEELDTAGVVARGTHDRGLYTEFRPGIKMGVKFKKEWFEAGIGYCGNILAYDSFEGSDNFDSDVDDTLSEAFEKYGNNYARFFENHITAYVKFKI